MTLAALSEQKHYMVLYERARQVIHVYKWGERIVDSLQKVNNKTIALNESILPQDFYVTSMCFDNKDDSLYILDNKNTIRCIELDTGLYRHDREIVCKEQYSKIMTTLEGGYIVGIKPHEQGEEKEQQTQILPVPVLMQSDCDLDVMIEEYMQAFDKASRNNDKLGNTDTEEEDIQILGSELTTTASSLVKRAPTGLVQCDFYVLDDSNELVRSLVLPKEFTSNGIHNIQFKLILQQQIYVVFLDSQFVLHCLPLHVSLKKSQLHVELISMHGNSTASDDQIIRSKKLSKLDYIEYKFYSLPKLTLHLSVLLDVNESRQSSSASWVSKERMTQASNLVLYACNKINHNTKKIFTFLDWQCVPKVINGIINPHDVLKLVKNRNSLRNGDDFIRQLIIQFPMQIARASEGEFILLHNGENNQARYARCITNSDFIERIRFGGYDALINSWPGKIRVISSMGKQSTGKSYMLNHLLGCKFDISGARCTDGVWITARIAGDVLYVILDFEGLGSFERSPQEDALLSVFNAAISNCTIFRCENRFDQDIAKMFERFQKGVQFLQDDNDKLFRGRLLIVVKDIAITDIKQVMNEFSKKIASFCRNGTNGESESFVMQMYKDSINIHVEPYPPLMHELFFKKLAALQILIEGSPKTHSGGIPPSPIIHVDGGIPFLRHMKAVMAKLAMKDWNSNLSDQIVESAVERVKQHIKSVINFGTLAISKEQESLERFDITENMEVVSLAKKEKII
ncbi:hypothetical protein RFI_39302, partial [Reticulomyxa filosa]